MRVPAKVIAMPIDNLDDRIPRDAVDDYSDAILQTRLRWLEARTSANLGVLIGGHVDPHVFRGNIESPIGTVQFPVGVAGPYLVRGQHVDGEVFVPMATTEGALVASYSRGMKAISASGGARTRLVSAHLTAGVTFVFADQAQAHAFIAWLGGVSERLRTSAQATTRHGKLLAVEPRAVGRRVFVNFVYDTADALGINMATVATAAASDWIMQNAIPTPLVRNLPGGMQGEKWANALDFISGRGRRVAAEATISRNVLKEQLRVEAGDMHDAWFSMSLAKMHAGGLGVSFHAANGVAAVMLATGQDAAYLTALTAISVIEALPTGDLYISIDIPTLGAGTIGGGTGLPSFQACLELMDCRGAGKANRLAEIIAAVAIAGETSTVAAIIAGEFVAAHQRLGRNPPPPSS
jgi:hydroxymethylglutaryl-CoA reductase (NADPH)